MKISLGECDFTKYTQSIAAAYFNSDVLLQCVYLFYDRRRVRFDTWYSKLIDPLGRRQIRTVQSIYKITQQCNTATILSTHSILWRKMQCISAVFFTEASIGGYFAKLLKHLATSNIYIYIVYSHPHTHSTQSQTGSRQSYGEPIYSNSSLLLR